MEEADDATAVAADGAADNAFLVCCNGNKDETSKGSNFGSDVGAPVVVFVVVFGSGGGVGRAGGGGVNVKGKVFEAV